MENNSKGELEFAVFCIENIGQKLGISGNRAYELLSKKSRILNNYILPNYEILHTQSKDYIVSDIIDYMKAEGVLE